MATNKFKSVMVNPSYELEFPTASEFVKVNNIATFGDNVSGTLKDLTIGSSTDGLKLYHEAVSDSAPSYSVIDSSGGLEFNVPCFLSDTGFNYTTIENILTGVSTYFSVDKNGSISATGSLTLNGTDADAATWSFNKGKIDYRNSGMHSTIDMSYSQADNGGGYSAISLLTHTYNDYTEHSTTSIKVNGNTGINLEHVNPEVGSSYIRLGTDNLVDIHAEGNVEISSSNDITLSGNVTINGQTPATFGDNVDAEFRNLTTHGPISVYGNINDTVYEAENALNVEAGPNSMPMLSITGPIGIKFNSPIFETIELYGFNAETEESSSVFTVDQDTLKYSGNKAILPLNTQIGSDNVNVSFSGDEYNGLIRLTAKALEFQLPGYSYRRDYDGIKLGKYDASYIYLNNEASGNVDIHAEDTVNISSSNNIALSGNVTINGNTPATFGDNVSGALKDLTIGGSTDGITINKNKLSAGGEYGSAITFNEDTLDVAAYVGVYINGYSSGVTITSSGGNIFLNSDNGKIVASSPVGIELRSPTTISDTFTIPVYTTDESGKYTKVKNERKTVRCVKQVLSDGTATYTLELA